MAFQSYFLGNQDLYACSSSYEDFSNFFTIMHHMLALLAKNSHQI